MSELNDMTCAELAEVAAELALGVLTGRERAMAVAHLEGCEACREDVRQLTATGEQLVELLPAAEPSAGFETRVLQRIGIPVPEQEEAQGSTYPRLLARGEGRKRGQPPRAAANPGRLGVPPARPGGTRRAGRLRQALAAAAVGLAVIAAGLGGWRVGLSASAGSDADQLTVASLVTAAHRDVGRIFFYSGRSQWLYMSVDLDSGEQTVQCQVVGADGRVTTVGSFQLAGGYGAWGSPDPGNVGHLRGARLVTATGAVLATATFPS